MSEFDRKPGNTSLCACTAQNWPKQPRTTATTSGSLLVAMHSQLPPFLVYNKQHIPGHLCAFYVCSCLSHEEKFAPAWHTPTTFLICNPCYQVCLSMLQQVIIQQRLSRSINISSIKQILNTLTEIYKFPTYNWLTLKNISTDRFISGLKSESYISIRLLAFCARDCPTVVLQHKLLFTNYQWHKHQQLTCNVISAAVGIVYLPSVL